MGIVIEARGIRGRSGRGPLLCEVEGEDEAAGVGADVFEECVHCDLAKLGLGYTAGVLNL